MIHKRYTILDSLRGVTLISMVLYHALWDLVYIFDAKISWFTSTNASIWQQSIRWIFIFLSGFCWHMGRKKIRRALTILACSLIISVVTIVFMPEAIILFGVLTLLGTGMLITIPLDKLFCKLSPYLGLVICCLLFVLTKDVELGTLSIGNLELLQLPEAIYANGFTAYLGFPNRDFISQDYVPLIPWIFMYWMGYFSYQIFKKKNLLKFLSAFQFKPLEWLGRHSLPIYMLHQPVVYGVLFFIFY